jgi:hypothetical protein
MRSRVADTNTITNGYSVDYGNPIDIHYTDGERFTINDPDPNTISVSGGSDVCYKFT